MVARILEQQRLAPWRMPIPDAIVVSVSAQRALRLRTARLLPGVALALSPGSALADCFVVVANETAGCTLSASGQSLSIRGGATLNGWITMAGLGTSLNVDDGGTFRYNASVPGGPPSQSIAMQQANQVVINNGNLEIVDNAFVDMIVAHASGFSITNGASGRIVNQSVLAAANAFSSFAAGGVSGTLLNSGTISAAGGSSEGVIFLPGGGGGLFTLENRAGATIHGDQAVVVNVTSDKRTVLRNAGVISRGGAGGEAIALGTGNDTVTLESTSVITGIVNARGGTDTLALGGTATDGTFDIGQVGAAAQYRGFEAYQKIEAGTWTLMGIAAAATTWSTSSGTLRLGSSALGMTQLITSGGNIAYANGVTMGSPITLNTTARLLVEGSDGATQTGVVSGTGAMIKDGDGMLLLGATNTHSGGTSIIGGTVQISADTNLGAAAILTLDAGTLRTTAGFTTGRQTVIDAGGGTFETLAGTTLNHHGVISGSGTLTKAGDGTLVLGAANNFAGGTSIAAGTLQIGNDNFTGSVVGDVVNHGTLAFARTNFITFSDVISGSGNLHKLAESGTLILTGDSAYSGGTIIAAGALQLGNGGTSGSIVGDVTNQGSLIFNRSNGLSIGGAITGAGVISQTGSGTTTLSGNSGTFAGSTDITNGTLWVNGLLGSGASTMSVSSGGTLGGNGTVGGTVAIADGNLTPGNSPGALTIAGDLALTGASVLNYEFGQADVIGGPLNDLTIVGGNLTLDGTLNVVTSAGGALGPGLYRVMSYGGALTNNGLVPGTQPAGSASLVQTSVANQVNLINTAGLTLNFWDGGAAPRNNGAVNGGDGVWQGEGGNDNWTETSGAINAPYMTGSLAIFSAAPGIVSVDNSLGAAVSGGMQFATSGYVVQGQPLTLAAGSNTLRVGDGSAPGEGYVATIASELTGAGGIDKTDLGTLVLTGANSYTGGTTVSAGTLQLGNGGTSGTIAGNVTNNATLAFDRADPVSFDATVSGTGSVVKLGANILTLTGGNTYTGPTTISAGTLQIGNGGTTGAIVGDVVDNGALVFNRANDIDFGGTVSGTGSLTKLGANTLTLTGNHTYTGGTTISAGTLQLGNGGASGSIAGDVSNSAALAVNRSDAFVFGGVISGGGSLAQLGTGTTILTGNSLYTGGTTISTGTLQLGDGGATGGIFGDITNNAALVFDRSNTLSINSVISGSGSVSQIGAGTTVLSGVNSYTGGTTISAGTLEISNDVNLGGATSELTFNGGALRNSFNVATARATILNTPGGTLETAPGTTLTHTGSMGGPGVLTKTGAGTLVLGADASYTGGTTLSAGTLQLGNGGDAGGVVGDIVNNASLVVDRRSALSLDGVISGSGTITKLNGNNLTLTGANSYAGGTLLKGGQITAGHASALGSGQLAMDEGTTLGFSLDGLALANDVLLTGTSDPVIDTAAFTEALSGIISGDGALTKAGSGALILSGANAYTGATTVSSGTLRAGAAHALSAASIHTVASSATLDSNGTHQNVAALTNAGTVNLAGAIAGITLTTEGAYVGNGGTLRLGTAVAGGVSISDRLVLDGPLASASGATTIQMANLDGLGALTTGDGIELVSGLNGATTTAQTSQSAFTLAGGHVDAGAFEYRLYAADAQGAGENWYLRSTVPAQPEIPGQPRPPGQPGEPVQPEPPGGPVTPGQPEQPAPPELVPTYRTEVPLLAAMPMQLRRADWVMLGNLHRRIGDEAPAASPADRGTGTTASASDPAIRRAWARAVYAELDIQQPGVAQVRSESNVTGLQAGTDMLAQETWQAGLYIGYLDGDANVTGNARGITARVGSNDVRSRFLGAYATWTDTNGWYVDAVVQAADHRYDVHPDRTPQVAGQARSVMASVEGGKAFALNERWSLEPQAQLAYQHHSLDDLTLSGARVQQDPASGWIARLGIRVKGDLAMAAGRVQPYGRVNAYLVDIDGDSTTFVGPAATTVLTTGSSYSAAELAAGATLAVSPVTSLYGEIGHQWGLDDAADVKSAAQVTIGIRILW